MKKTALPLRFLKLNDNGIHLLLSVKINGKKARVLIDTGASNTVFDKKRLPGFLKGEKMKAEERLSTGLGTNSMTSLSAVIHKLKFGKISIEDHFALVLDLSHVNKSYEAIHIKPIDGVIGGDILKKFKARIDYGKKKLILSEPVPEKKKASGRKI